MGLRILGLDHAPLLLLDEVGTLIPLQAIPFDVEVAMEVLGGCLGLQDCFLRVLQIQG